MAEDTSPLKTYHDECMTLHRHEDMLLNNRLQTFVVSTAFLVGAYAQFRSPELRPVLLRSIVCIFGVSLASVFLNLLSRTTTAIEWYICEIRANENVIYSQAFQPYNRRRGARAEPKWPVSTLLGRWVPRGAIVLWCALFASNFSRWCPIAISSLSILLYSVTLLKILDMKKEQPICTPAPIPTSTSTSSAQTTQTPTPKSRTSQSPYSHSTPSTQSDDAAEPS